MAEEKNPVNTTSNTDVVQTGDEVEVLIPRTISQHLHIMENSLEEMRNSQLDLHQMMKTLTEQIDLMSTQPNYNPQPRNQDNYDALVQPHGRHAPYQARTHQEIA